MPDAGISNLFPEIATPVCALVHNDSGGAEIATPVCALARNDSEVGCHCGGEKTPSTADVVPLPQ